MINSAEISVVIQGPVVGKPDEPYDAQGTQQCINNLREHLPDAEIIISTWEGTLVNHLKGYDKMVFSEDPGAITYNDFELKGVYNNNNRQIVSTYVGLKAATKKYAIKFRADFRLSGLKFISFFNKFENRGKYAFFSNRIVISNLGSRNSSKTPVLFAISDLFQFGFTNDLIDLWEIPLQPEPETTRAFPYKKQFLADPFRYNQFKMKYSCEQYIWYAYTMKRNLDLSLKYYCEIPLKKVIPAICSVIDNFVIVDFDKLDVLPPDRLKHSLELMINFNLWREYYKKINNKYFLLSHFISVFSCKCKYVLKNAFNL